MKIYAEKGHSLTEAERLELGRLLLKAGYLVRMGREKQGSTICHYIEFFRRSDLGAEKTAPDVTSIKSGQAE
ncbi:MAG: resolvase [Pseudoflavonifractor sp.]